MLMVIVMVLDRVIEMVMFFDKVIVITMVLLIVWDKVIMM